MSRSRGLTLLTWLVIVGAAAAAIGGGYWYYLRQKNATPEYQTAPVARGDLIQIVTASGQLNPVLNVEVGSQISGRIREIFVDFNSEVKSNQVIAQIDPSTYQMAVQRASAEMSNSVANLALAAVEARRAAALVADDLISTSEYETAVAMHQQAEARVDSSRASLDSALVDLSRCTIYAPVDGVVISRAVDVGQTVAASFNTPRLFLIANDLSKMQIDALVSEADIGSVAVNQPVDFTVDAYPYRTFRGALSQIRYGPVTNQNVVNYNCIIHVDNSDLKLLPGMTANVSIVIAERQDTLKIPNAALRFRPPEGALAGSSTNAPRSGARADAGSRDRGGAREGAGDRGGSRGGPRQSGQRGDGSLRSGGGGGGGGGRGSFRTVYVMKSGALGKPMLEAVQVRTGITDGLTTEIVDGLKEGDQVVTGMDTAVAAPGSGQAGSPFGRGGFRRF